MIKYPYIGLGYGLISLVATTMYVCQREGGRDDEEVRRRGAYIVVRWAYKVNSSM